MKYWEVKMKADKTGELLLYGNISNSSYWGDEVSPKQIDADLKALGELDTLNVRINSGGGNVFAGQAIYTIIKRHEAKVKNAYIDGLAASMASVIPLACHKVYMPNNAMMMIHKPWGSVTGNADLMRQRADLVDKLEEGALNIYEEKTKLGIDKLKEMLAAETWMTAKEALDFGFIDEIEQDVKIAASMDGDFLVVGGIKVDTSEFINFETYREALKPPEPVANIDPPPPDLSEQSKEFYRIKNKIYNKYGEER